MMNILEERLLSPTVAILVVIAVPTAIWAEEPRIAREAIEWCDIWIPDANDGKLPRVLLIGDSITRGYAPKVADNLNLRGPAGDLEVHWRSGAVGRGGVGTRAAS
jgi:hypothetical protein